MAQAMESQLQGLLAAGPQRLVAGIVLAALLLILLSLSLRGLLGTLCRIAVFVGAMAIIVGGIAILMNNVSLAGPPSATARLQRYLTVNWAATSDNGDGTAACLDPAQLAARQPTDVEHRARRHLRHSAARAAAEPEASPTPAAEADGAGGGETEPGFPELVRNAYPGIPPARLMQIAATTAAGLPGWQIVSVDRKTLTINALYRTRVLGLLEDVRIVVTPRSEVDVCSRSRAGEPGSESTFSAFHGDFGSNIGRIKEFYLALAPVADDTYRRVEVEQTTQPREIKVLRP
jgi:hypothetical protein